MPLDHIAIIAARAGSKRVPGKNLKPLGGMPLIGWTIAAALRSGRFARVMVSTDGAEIRDLALAHGAEVPFLRPPELATDTATSTDVLLDHLQRIGVDEGAERTVITLLQPTSPFRRVSTIVRALALFEQQPALSLVGVSPPKAPLAWIRRVDAAGQLQPLAQAEPADASTCVLNGLIYVIAAPSLLRGRSLYAGGARPFRTDDAIESLDIDTPADWAVASALVAAGAVTLSSILEG